uniref:Uncharacterized protein n=1 Tax=Aegilops tauschii subsp. strangulata TaxID=200361 RepID=A0A453NYX2_AEGTS
SLVRPWGGRLRCLVWLLYSSISQTGQRRRSGSRAQGRSGSREETSSSILTALLPSASIQPGRSSSSWTGSLISAAHSSTCRSPFSLFLPLSCFCFLSFFCMCMGKPI